MEKDESPQEQNTIEDKLEGKDNPESKKNNSLLKLVDGPGSNKINSLLVKGTCSGFIGGCLEIIAIHMYHNWETPNYSLLPGLIGGYLGIYGLSRIYKAYKLMKKS